MYRKSKAYFHIKNEYSILNLSVLKLTLNMFYYWHYLMVPSSIQAIYRHIGILFKQESKKKLK